MADRRMLSATVAEDEELNRLSIEAQLLFLMTIPHLDRDGLITGNPRVLFGRVCPLRDELRDRILVLVNEWVEQGLVRKYAGSDGCAVLFFEAFRRHQAGLEYEREKPSKFPPPPGWIRTKAGLVPEDEFQALTLAEAFDVRSAYRRALLERAGAAAPAAPAAQAAPAEKAADADGSSGGGILAEAEAVIEAVERRDEFQGGFRSHDRAGSSESGATSRPHRDVVTTASRPDRALKPNRKLTMADDDDGQSLPSAPGSCVVGGVQGGEFRGFDWERSGLDAAGLRAFCVQLIEAAYGTSWDAARVYVAGLDDGDCERLAGWLWKVIVRPEWSCDTERPIGVGFVRSMMKRAGARASMAPGEWSDLRAAAAFFAADPGAELFGGVVLPGRRGKEAEDGVALDY